ncbi:NYN domain-containing protein [Paraeggerthella hongkongensis]|uniref:NYN domain-containing protein n=1 Tax=Paraeggerthella hominis TaxID=2897351 RepID=UPI001C112E26|nr:MULTISPECIES: NYN domain-containing protein [Paraeggerthella]MBU5406277.1 NYN domain-containing protein [Paraeggerthella hongkongensis]MCD2434127.1 NYN domain-containing protein [Paraeggerthella hominis]
MDIKPSSEKRFALLIDADNVSAKYIKPITDELSKYGTVTYKRIYGDWTLTLHSKWKDALLENSITPIQQFGYTQGKNATDSAMIIDAMDILYTRSVEGFCIVSSDSDFTRLASRIRESGLTVIGMGEKKTPTAFRKACDIFTTLELLLGDSNGKGGKGKGHRDQGNSQGGQNTGPSIEEIEQAVVNIITDNQNNGKSTGVGEVGSRLLKRYPDFDVRSYGTNQLTKLLGEFGSVQIIKDGSSVAIELTEAKEASKPAEKEGTSEPARKPSRSAGKPAHKPAPADREKESETALASEAAGKPEAETASEPAAKPARRSLRRRRGAEGAQPKEASDQPSSSDEAPVSADEAMPAPESAPAAESAPEAAAAADAETSDASADRPEQGVRKPVRRGRRGGAKRSRPAGDDATEKRPSQQAANEDAASQQPAATADADRVAASASASRPASNPDRFVRQLVRDAGVEGVAVSELSKRVRAKYRDFKVRDLGYSQFRSYVADLGDIEIEKNGKDFFARLAE